VVERVFFGLSSDLAVARPLRILDAAGACEEKVHKRCSRLIREPAARLLHAEGSLELMRGNMPLR
jgi:hypothetical protein